MNKVVVFCFLDWGGWKHTSSARPSKLCRTDHNMDFSGLFGQRMCSVVWILGSRMGCTHFQRQAEAQPLVWQDQKRYKDIGMLIHRPLLEVDLLQDLTPTPNEGHWLKPGPSDDKSEMHIINFSILGQDYLHEFFVLFKSFNINGVHVDWNNICTGCYIML